MITLALLSLACLAADEDEHDAFDADLKVSGHVKTFAIGTLPYDHPLMPPAPAGQAFVDARLNLAGHIGDHLQFEVAHAVTASLGAVAAVGVTNTGVAPRAPQLVDLGWTAFDQDASTLGLVGRTDRLNVKVSRPGLDVTLGRQPVSFGSGLFFTPLDLVNPFTPATIDTEYKPGVDALRMDAYRGVSTHLTAVVTWSASPPGQEQTLQGLERVSAALEGRTTVGVTDLGLFVGALHGDGVFGATVISSAGPVGLHGDVALTLPRADDEDPFVRAVLGADVRPHERLMLMGEVYVQTLGSTDPGDLLTTLQKARWQRGELWLGGVLYAGLSASLEITPLVHLNAAVFANLTDPSTMLAPSLSWSVADNVDLALGGYVGVGRRPDPVPVPPTFGLNSEFGLYPGVVFLQVRAYF